MKLSQLVLKPDLRIRDLPSTTLTASDTLALSFDGGIVTITRLDRPDEEPFLLPFTNVHFMRPLASLKEATAKKAA